MRPPELRRPPAAVKLPQPGPGQPSPSPWELPFPLHHSRLLPGRAQQLPGGPKRWTGYSRPLLPERPLPPPLRMAIPHCLLREPETQSPQNRRLPQEGPPPEGAPSLLQAELAEPQHRFPTGLRFPWRQRQRPPPPWPLAPHGPLLQPRPPVGDDHQPRHAGLPPPNSAHAAGSQRHRRPRRRPPSPDRHLLPRGLPPVESMGPIADHGARQCSRGREGTDGP